MNHLPDLPEPTDPALDGLLRALTAPGTAAELSARQAALEMFNGNRPAPPHARLEDHRPQDSRPEDRRPAGHRPAGRRPRGRRLAAWLSTAAAVVVMAGWIAAAYAAALPGPVQHITYRMLGSIGVPDSHRRAPSSGPPRSVPPTPPVASTAPASPGPAPAVGPALVLAAAQAQIPAGGDDVLSGRLAPGGRPETGARVRLLERVGNRRGWRVARTAITGPGGDVTFTVRHLTSNAFFVLAGPGRAASAAVPVTVLPPVYLSMAPGQAGLEEITARAPSADAGDPVVLQELSAGVWYRVTERTLGRDHQASFTVIIPTSGGMEYRVVLPRTAWHGSSVSGQVRVTARTGVRASSRTRRRASG